MGTQPDLAKNPDQAEIDVGDGPMAVGVELLQGEERESAWDRVAEPAPGYGAYLEKTDRKLPIIRLTPRG